MRVSVQSVLVNLEFWSAVCLICTLVLSQLSQSQMKEYSTAELWFNAHRRIEPRVTENSSTVIASQNCGLERQVATTCHACHATAATVHLTLAHLWAIPGRSLSLTLHHVWHFVHLFSCLATQRCWTPDKMMDKIHICAWGVMIISLLQRSVSPQDTEQCTTKCCNLLC